MLLQKRHKLYQPDLKDIGKYSFVSQCFQVRIGIFKQLYMFIIIQLVCLSFLVPCTTIDPREAVPEVSKGKGYINQEKMCL